MGAELRAPRLPFWMLVRGPLKLITRPALVSFSLPTRTPGESTPSMLQTRIKVFSHCEASWGFADDNTVLDFCNRNLRGKLSVSEKGECHDLASHRPRDLLPHRQFAVVVDPAIPLAWPIRLVVIVAFVLICILVLINYLPIGAIPRGRWG